MQNLVSPKIFLDYTILSTWKSNVISMLIFLDLDKARYQKVI